MGQHRDLAAGNVLPETLLDALQTFLATFASANFTLELASPTSVRVPAGAGADQVSLAFGGPWRHIEADTTAAHPGGVAGNFDIFAISTANAFPNPPAVGQADVDDTVYSFQLKVMAAGGTPSGAGAEAIYRKVGRCVWDGAKIIGLVQLVNRNVAEARTTDLGEIRYRYPDASEAAPFKARPGWALCDGAAWGTIPNDLGYSSGNIPNLMGKHAIGADPTKAKNTASTFNAASGALTDPGVGGTGGENVTDERHDHPVSGATGNTLLTTNPAGGHGHTLTGKETNISNTVSGNSFIVPLGSGFGYNANNVIGGVGDHAHSIPQHNHGINFQSGGRSGAQFSDNRSAHVGLIVEMKVKVL